MAKTVEKSGRVAKRKNPSSDKRPAKRARSESSDEGEADVEAQILLLENEIVESKKNYNNIAELIILLRDEDEDPDASMLAAISLCRVFTRLFVSGELSKKPNSTEKEATVLNWLKSRYSEYKESLLNLLYQDGGGSNILTLLMRLLKAEHQYLQPGGNYNFPAEFLTEIIQALVQPDSDAQVRKEFSEKYVEEYDDVRFYTFQAIERVLRGCDERSGQEIFDNCVEVMKAVESVPESKEEIEDFYVPAPKTTHALYSLAQHKRKAQEAWLALIKLDMSKDQRKTILGLISQTIAPWFAKPELLMDFLTDSYNTGGSTSLQALSGVFYLIQEKNLDYPLFYPKLYSLLDANILHSKHRSRFFRLLDTFLASTHLPAALVASFIKRLSRLCLNAPPAGIVAVVPWIYNLLKRHPTCTFMIHRETRDPELKKLMENEGLEDCFIMEEEDPMKTQAIDSCLWEIVMLQSHYHPNVATLAKIISEQFTKHSYNLEDFLDHSYGSMLEAELDKEVKKIPAIEYEIPKKILTKHEADSGLEDGLLVKLWDF
ncbi:nucleolar complex protein-like protein [Xylogone sp. PMI_703]|nr:nucleolar complex protein-like protein [Xylogone sp. PMI_703]